MRFGLCHIKTLFFSSNIIILNTESKLETTKISNIKSCKKRILLIRYKDICNVNIYLPESGQNFLRGFSRQESRRKPDFLQPIWGIPKRKNDPNDPIII